MTLPKVVGPVRRFLEWPHQWLVSRSRWYKSWHETPHHHAVHRRIVLHATVGSTAIVVAKGLAVLSIIVGLQGNALASLAQTWTTQAEFNNFALTNTTTTSDGGGTITLNGMGGGSGSWSEVSDVPSLATGWTDVAATADNNVWIAGFRGAVQYNGSSWTSHPDIIAEGTTIGSILTFGQNDTWIFSNYGAAVHWNGSSWTPQYVQMGDSSWAAFESSWGTDSSHIWAGANGAIFFYNGSTWTQQISPGSCVGKFLSISGTSTSDIWTANDAGWGSTGCPSIWRYNGSSWSVATDPAPIGIMGVYSPVNGATWAIDYVGSTAYYTTGGSLPSTSIGASHLKDIDGTSASDIWTVGTLGGGYNLAHYNGSSWTPGYATLADDLVSVDAISTSSVYAVSSSILYHYAAGTVYQSSGTATLAYTPQAGQNNDWTTASVSTTTPTNTTVTTEYSHNNSTWTTDLGSVPASESLYLKLTLATTDTAVTPAVNSLTVNYDLIAATVTVPVAGTTNYANEPTDTLGLAWTATGTGGADHIHLQYSTNSGGAWSDIPGATSLATSATSFNWDTPDVSSSTLRLKVILEDASNNALASSTSSADFSLVYDPTPPTLSAVATSNGALNTQASTGNVITVTINSNEALVSAPTVTVGGLATDCSGSGTNWTCTRTVTSADQFGSQTISVSGQDLAGNISNVTANSISIQQPETTTTTPPTATPPTATKPSPVSNIKTFISSNSINITYDAPAAGTSVRIWRSTSNTEQGELITETSQSSYRDTSATIGVTHYYTLVTVRNSDQITSDGRTTNGKISSDYSWSIVINPKTVTAKPGGSVQLTASVYDAWGQAKTIPVNWSTTNNVGSISKSGVLTASTNPGVYRQSAIATVDYQGLRGQASVDVIIDAGENLVSRIQIDPPSVTLQPGQTKQYAATVYNQNNTPLSIDRSRLTWTTSAGSITTGGLLTAHTQTGTIDKGVTVSYTDSTGKVWQSYGRVTISTEAPGLKFLLMSGHLRILPGQQNRYSAYSYDQFFNQIRTAQEPVQFYSSSPESGSIDSIGRFHAGQTEGCYYWSLKAERTLNSRYARVWSGVITKRYSQTEIDILNAKNLVGFTQYRFTNRPGSVTTFSALPYDGWGYYRPQTVVKFKLLDDRAGTITDNGVYTAGQQVGVFNEVLQIIFVNTVTGVETPAMNYTLSVAPDEPRLTYANSRSVNAGPFSVGQAGVNPLYFDQYGMRYTSTMPNRTYSLLGSNSNILQNGQIETGSPEILNNSINATVDGLGELPVPSRGNLTVAAKYALDCNATTSLPGGEDGTDVDLDDSGGLVYFLGSDKIIPNTPDAKALQLEASKANKNKEEVDISIADQNGLPSPWQEAASWIQRIIAPLSALAILTSLPTVLAGLIQAIGEILGRFAAGLTNLLQAITSYRRPRATGKVLDGRKRQPIAGATAQLLTPDTRQIVDTQHTDAQGQYVFLVDGRRALLLSVTANGFKPYTRLVRGDNIHRIVRLGLELERDETALKGHVFWQKLFNLLSASRITLITLGTVAWMVSLISTPSKLLFYLGFYYLFAWLLELYIAKMPRPYGVVMDAVTGQPLDHVVVRIINRRQRIIGTEVTDHLGRFRTMITPGVYTFTYSRAGYDAVSHFGAVFPKSSRSFRVDAELKRHVDPLTPPA